MPDEEEMHNNDDACSATDAIREDTNAIAGETKNLMIEAKSGLTMLICGILFMSLLSILLSTWLAKTITNTPTSFGSIVSHYFGFDRNETEEYLTWWKPIHVKPNEIISGNSSSINNNNNNNNSTAKLIPLKIPYSDYPNFHTIVLPLLFICSILLAVLAYYARVKCTSRNFTFGAVPKIPLLRMEKTADIMKAKEAEPGIDYTIVQGTKDEPVVFALAETLQPLREEGDIVDEGTQYESEDLLKVITHVSSAPQLHTNIEIVPSNEQQHIIELLQREPLPTLSPSK